MSVDFKYDPQYDTVLERLKERTLEGRIVWQETAEEDVFLAAVKGEQTFQIRKTCVIESLAEVEVVRVLVKDSEGETLFTTPGARGGVAFELFNLAKRIATGIDEKIDRTVQLLSNL